MLVINVMMKARNIQTNGPIGSFAGGVVGSRTTGPRIVDFVMGLWSVRRGREGFGKVGKGLEIRSR
jgi:hypothetical protein